MQTTPVYRVIASLSSDQSFVGEIVCFNCLGNPATYETARAQAERYAEIFTRTGNSMIANVMQATGATRVEYRVQIA